MPKFKLSNKPKKPDLSSVTLFIISSGGNLLYDESDKSVFFSNDKLLLDFNALKDQIIYIGKLDSKEIYAIDFSSFSSQNLKFVNPRLLLDDMEPDDRSVIFRSLQLLNWNKNSQYCGCCGGKTHMSEVEFVKDCINCNQKFFPQYSPAIIVRVTRGDEILLGRSYHFKKGIYSTLAGFVEAGESCEDAVHREVYEEAGIEIQNIKYHSVQPWPFPNSLMIGYTAEYKSGDLKVDTNELEDAQWFHVDKLPTLPMKSTIAYQLINEFVQNNQRKARLVPIKASFHNDDSIYSSNEANKTFMVSYSTLKSLLIETQNNFSKFFNSKTASNEVFQSENNIGWMRKEIDKIQWEEWKKKYNEEYPNAEKNGYGPGALVIYNNKF
jgi:NAD+ diphosphatase